MGFIFQTTVDSTWNSLNEGWNIYGEGEVYSLMISNNYLFAGTNGVGVWRISISQLITSIDNLDENLPVTYSLQQNYPNPFNPSTRIDYTIPKSSFVTIKIYDVLGREVAALVNKEKHEGNYEVNFDAAEFNLPSGIYFYQLIAVDLLNKKDNFISTKKMILLK